MGEQTLAPHSSSLFEAVRLKLLFSLIAFGTIHFHSLVCAEMLKDLVWDLSRRHNRITLCTQNTTTANSHPPAWRHMCWLYFIE